MARVCRFRVSLHLSSDAQVQTVFEEHEAEYRDIFVEFIQRQVRHIERMRVGEAIGRFPLSSDGASTWYGEDLSAYVRVTPVHVVRTTDGEDQDEIDGTNDVNPNDVSIQLEEVEVRYSGAVDVRTSCMVLSCLLQYTPETRRTLRYVGALRRCVLNDLIHDVQRSSLVQFDTGHLHACLEEWLGMPREHYAAISSSDTSIAADTNNNNINDDTNNNNSNDRTSNNDAVLALPEGRSAGLVVTGSKGVGKTVFVKSMLIRFQRFAPWLFAVLDLGAYLNDNENDVAAVRYVDDDAEFFDGAQLTLEKAEFGDDDIEVRHPIKRLFRRLKALARPGKIVITFIDNCDHLSSPKYALAADHFFHGINSATYEFFLFGATGSFHRHLSMRGRTAKRSYSMEKFRTLKVCNISIEQGYDYIVDRISNPPSLPYPPAVMRSLRSCARAARHGLDFLSRERRNAAIARRREVELRLHNMRISDLDKIVLQTTIFLANRFSENLHLATEPMTDEHYLQTFEDALESIINSVDIMSGLNPDVIASSDWIRHDTHFHPSIPGIVQSIYQKATNFGQFVHFIKLVPPGHSTTMSNQLESFRKRQFTIPTDSAFSLLYHLHRIFAFNGSYILDSPDQLLAAPKADPSSRFAGPGGSGNTQTPFDDFFWHNHHALLLLPHLETLVGFQQESRVSQTTTKTASRSNSASTSQSHSMSTSIGWAANLATQIAHSLGIGEGVTTSFKYGNGSSTDLTAGFTSFSLSGKLGYSSSLDNTLAKASTWSLSRGVNLTPATTVNCSRSSSNSASKSLGESASAGENLAEQRVEKRTFRHPEAMTKVVVGLKNLSESRARDLEEVRNLVVVFYSHDECYEEVVRNRLGWNEDGEYPSRPVGCSHYNRYLRMKAPCCGLWVDCEKCHDEQVRDHRMNRTAVSEIQCLLCYVQQPVPIATTTTATNPTSSSPGCASMPTEVPGTRCQNPYCNRRMAVSCCLKCRLWRDYLLPDGFKHCDGCEECYPTRYYPFHRQICPGLHATRMKPLEQLSPRLHQHVEARTEKERIRAHAKRIMDELELEAMSRSSSMHSTHQLPTGPHAHSTMQPSSLSNLNAGLSNLNAGEGYTDGRNGMTSGAGGASTLHMPPAMEDFDLGP